MEATNNNEKKIYVSFHIGRGGRWHNPGYLSFYGEENFQDLIKRCAEQCVIYNEDEEGNTLPDDEWKIFDFGSNIILQGRKEIEALTGVLEWDTIYDTDYVTTTDELSEKEIDAIYKAYLEGVTFMSEELEDFICSLKEDDI